MTEKGVLSRRQKAFVHEYAKCRVAKQAALRAGYSPKSCAVTAHKLMRRPHVALAIEQAENLRFERCEVKADNVLRELCRIAFADGSKVFPRLVGGKLEQPDIQALDDEIKATIEEVAIGKTGVRVKRYDKMKALELLGKYLAMWTDRQEITGDIDQPLVVVAAKEQQEPQKALPA